MKTNKRIIVVTGSGRGIGAAIVMRSARAGAAVALNFLRNRVAAAKTMAEALSYGAEAIQIQADVREGEDAQRLIAEAVGAFGGVDVLVNCAHTAFKPVELEALTWTDIQQQIEGTLKSALGCTQAALPYLLEGREPAVLNLSSVTVQRTPPGFLHRNVAKAALEGFTRSAAEELAPKGIRVNAIAIGWTDTDQLTEIESSLISGAVAITPLRRLAKPSEIAEVAYFLVSPASSYITGTVFPVAGGMAPDMR